MKKRQHQFIRILYICAILVCMTAQTAMAATDTGAVSYGGSKYLISAVLIIISVTAGILAGIYVRRKTK